MRFVDIQVTDTGNLINPLIYLEQLIDLAPQLPPGARTFATDPAVCAATACPSSSRSAG